MQCPMIGQQVDDAALFTLHFHLNVMVQQQHPYHDTPKFIHIHAGPFVYFYKFSFLSFLHCIADGNNAEGSRKLALLLPTIKLAKTMICICLY